MTIPNPDPGRIPPDYEPLVVPAADDPDPYPLLPVGAPTERPAAKSVTGFDDADAALEDPSPSRPAHRRFFAQVVVGAAVAMALGHTLRTMSQFGANDISRWCTVWSLLERGTYAIDDCPWQANTQDKVKKPDKIANPGPGAGPLKRFEFAIAPHAWRVGEPVERFYSSKPPLLPTLIAGILYPARALSKVPLDEVVEQTRLERNVQKPVPDDPGKTITVKETPPPAPWPAYVFYFKPVIILLNVAPMLAFLVLYTRLLDRTADGDWSWSLCLVAAAFCTYLFDFMQTLNNHTVAAWSAFFAIYALQRVWSEGETSGRAFASAGFFGAFTACNELPAAVFGLLLFLFLFVRFPGKTLKFFVPAAAVPCLAFLATQYIAFGQFRPVYEEFGTKSYTYEGSYWNTPLEMDWFNLKENQEPPEVYLFHMTLGHHGVFSLTPIFLFSLIGTVREIIRRGKLSAVAWLTLLLTVAMFAFYTWNPKARNYGGSTQGLRWLFWLIPFWLVMLPSGIIGGDRNRWVRGLSLAALGVSALSVGYALRNPWSHPWILDALEHLDLYPMVR
jgi:hypothetical protein